MITALSPLLILIMHDFKALLTNKKPMPITVDAKASVVLADTIKRHKDIAVLDQANLELISDAYENRIMRSVRQGRFYLHLLGFRVGMATAGRNFWLLAAFYMALGLKLEYLKLDVVPVLEAIIVIFFVTCLVGFRFAELPSWEKTE